MFMSKKKFSFRKSWRKKLRRKIPRAHLKINLTSLQHDFLHLNDMWRKFLFSFWLFLEKENRREKRGETRARQRRRRYKKSHQSYQRKWCPLFDSWVSESIWLRRWIHDRPLSPSLLIVPGSSLCRRVALLQEGKTRKFIKNCWHK